MCPKNQPPVPFTLSSTVHKTCWPTLPMPGLTNWHWLPMGYWPLVTWPTACVSCHPGTDNNGLELGWFPNWIHVQLSLVSRPSLETDKDRQQQPWPIYLSLPFVTWQSSTLHWLPGLWPCDQGAEDWPWHCHWPQQPLVIWLTNCYCHWSLDPHNGCQDCDYGAEDWYNMLSS